METIGWVRVCSAIVVGAMVLAPPQVLAEPPDSPDTSLGQVESNSPATLTIEQPSAGTSEPAADGEPEGSLTGSNVPDSLLQNEQVNGEVDPQATTVATPPFEPPARELEPIGSDAGLFQLGSRSSSDQTRASQASGGGGLPELVRVGGSLAVVLGILFALAFLGRKMSGLRMRAGRPAGILEVLARYPLGKGHHLVLLKLDRRVILVHQSGSSMATLTELSEPTEVASILSKIEASSRGGGGDCFQDKLSTAGRRYAQEDTSTTETVDLTRSRVTGLIRALRRKQVAA